MSSGNQAALCRARHDRRAIGDPKFLDELADMMANGKRTEMKLLGNLLVGHPFAQQQKHFTLSIRKVDFGVRPSR